MKSIVRRILSMLCAAALSCGVTAVAANDIEPREAKNEYTVTIPAGQTATLPQWGPSITTGTVLDIKLADTTPDYATIGFTLQCSNGGGFNYDISEGQTRRITTHNTGKYTITFTSSKTVVAKVVLTIEPDN